jgi:transposase
MLNPSRYLGVDVSKDTLVVAFERNRLQFSNSKEGHRKLIAQIKKQSVLQPAPVHVICEATGPYHLPMCLALQAAGVAVTISNPARIHYFGRSEGVLAKNDPIDAALIERFGNSKRPPADPPLCPEQIALSEMINHRRQLVDAITVFRTHRQQVLDASLRQEIDKSIAAFQKRVEALERQLRQKIDANPTWKKKLDLLMTAKGVGFLTALVLVVKMPELGSLNRGQCAALSGLAPYDDDSGSQQNKRSIRGGRSEVRSAMYMAALSAIRFNPILKAIYQRMRKNKRPAKVAMIAVMRKMLIYLNALLKTLSAQASPA